MGVLLVLDVQRLLLYLLLLSVGVIGLVGFSIVGGNSVTYAVNELLLTSCLVRSLG